eukprot:scaffold20960_cov54-Attheya_sp.AAC.1
MLQVWGELSITHTCPQTMCVPAMSREQNFTHPSNGKASRPLLNLLFCKTADSSRSRGLKV